jgi:hypothetical protein
MRPFISISLMSDKRHNFPFSFVSTLIDRHLHKFSFFYINSSVKREQVLAHMYVTQAHLTKQWRNRNYAHVPTMPITVPGFEPGKCVSEFKANAIVSQSHGM